MVTGSVEQHVSHLRAALDCFVADAGTAGPEARVPTCRAWTVRKLVAHQGMVHRWARANLRGEKCHPASWKAEGQQMADPLSWLADGAADLIATLEAVPDDVRARVFLKDAPAPRLFWARRQCHETTIHAVDALAARLGRFPLPEDTNLTDDVALDGIDEVLTGFVTRGSSSFAGVDPVHVLVRPTGHDRSWSVLVRDGTAVTTRLPPGDGRAANQGVPVGAGSVAQVCLDGAAVGLYLALWNRTTADAVDDPQEFLAMWREHVRVRWS